MSELHPAIAVIIGRAGSKGLPGKNARRLAGRPVVAYSVDSARAARCVGRVAVSTDGEAIADAARQAGAELVVRPLALATDTASVSSAVRHAVIALDASDAVIVILYANVPIRPSGLIDAAVKTLRETGADSVQSYSAVGKHHPHWMVRLDAEHRVTPLHEGRVDRRQDLPPLHLPDGGVIAVTRSALLDSDPADPHAFFGTDRRGIINPPGTIVDIDDAADLARAAAMLERRSARERAG